MGRRGPGLENPVFARLHRLVISQNEQRRNSPNYLFPHESNLFEFGNVSTGTKNLLVQSTIDEQILNSTVAQADGVSLQAFLKAFDNVVVCMNSDSGIILSFRTRLGCQRRTFM